MKVLVTGAGGFVGAAVARAAASTGAEVTGTLRNPSAAGQASAIEGVRFAPLDLTDGAAIARFLQRERPEALVHCAWTGLHGNSRQDLSQLRDNVMPAVNLAAAALEAGVTTFVGIGSQAEYGAIDGRVSETALPQPSTLYGAAKLAAYHLIAALTHGSSIRFAWLRLFAAYGPGDGPRWLIPSVLAHLRAGQCPPLTPGTQKWDYLYIDDVAAAVLAVVKTPQARGIFNLASDDPVPVSTIVERLRDLVAPGVELAFGTVPFPHQQIMHMQGNNERLRATTGWRPEIALDEGLARTAASPI